MLLAAIQSAIDGNIQSRVPQEAPDYVVIDLAPENEAQFTELVTSSFPDAVVRTVPTMRGAVLAFGPEGDMQRTADLEEIPDGAWALRGERGITYSDTAPDGSRVVEGSWWSPFHNGEPLVSIDKEFADAAGLEVGDMLTMGILGQTRDVRIANLREIDWETMGFNFTMVFSRNAISDVPHKLSATIDLPDGAGTQERAELLRAMVREYPSSSVVEVGDVLVQAATLLEQVGLATLAAAAVAVLAGLAVLMGAIAAARAARTYDTVVLRVMGASRRQILGLQLAEYGLIAGALALVALALGSGLAWVIITQLFEFDWLPDWGVVLAVLGMGLAMVLAFALGGSLPLLRAKPAQALREL